MRVWIHAEQDVHRLEEVTNDCLDAMAESHDKIIDIRLATSESRTVVMILWEPPKPQGLVE
jgi:hypothetical protein